MYMHSIFYLITAVFGKSHLRHGHRQAIAQRSEASEVEGLGDGDMHSHQLITNAAIRYELDIGVNFGYINTSEGKVAQAVDIYTGAVALKGSDIYTGAIDVKVGGDIYTGAVPVKGGGDIYTGAVVVTKPTDIYTGAVVVTEPTDIYTGAVVVTEPTDIYTGAVVVTEPADVDTSTIVVTEPADVDTSTIVVTDSDKIVTGAGLGTENAIEVEASYTVIGDMVTSDKGIKEYTFIGKDWTLWEKVESSGLSSSIYIHWYAVLVLFIGVAL